MLKTERPQESKGTAGPISDEVWAQALAGAAAAEKGASKQVPAVAPPAGAGQKGCLPTRVEKESKATAGLTRDEWAQACSSIGRRSSGGAGCL